MATQPTQFFKSKPHTIVTPQVKDEDGRLMNDFTGRIKRDEWKPPSGFQRTLTVALDTAQYQIDMESMAAHKSEDVYSSFNVLMRRKPKVGLN